MSITTVASGFLSAASWIPAYAGMTLVTVHWPKNDVLHKFPIRGLSKCAICSF